jgi:hypothetical protein
MHTLCHPPGRTSDIVCVCVCVCVCETVCLRAVFSTVAVQTLIALNRVAYTIVHLDACGHTDKRAPPSHTHTHSHTHMYTHIHTRTQVGMPDLPYGGVWKRPAWMGYGRAIVQTEVGKPGVITLTVTSPGLASGKASFTSV